MTAINDGIDAALFQYIEKSIEETPYYRTLSIALSRIGSGTAEVVVTSKVEHTNPLGLIHGGLIMSLVDAAMGNAVRSLGIRGVTVDCSTAFLSSAALGEKITARGRVLKSGKSLIFAHAEVWSGEKIIADSKATFANTGIITF
ncbi:MAG: PaaI family thioesterase [Syntrophomonadaceae bacterium]|nr:PaaI family thioesterase [Syntrophomonadaceae bacterium]